MIINICPVKKNLFTHSDQSDYPLTVGCGGWNYIDNNDGSFTINYRLVMDIEGYPAWAINYINYCNYQIG